jgi:hypothetical protein
MNDFMREVEAVRDELAAMKQRAAGHASPKGPRAVAEERAAAMVDELARSSLAAKVGFNLTLREFSGAEFFDTSSNVREVPRFMAWLDPEKFKARLREDIAKHYKRGDDGMTAEAAAAEHDKIKKILFDLEVKEDRLIRKARAAGIVIDRRLDADPAAILAACE